VAPQATYRVGPSDFFTPGDLASDADKLDSQIKAFDIAIDGNYQIPNDLWDSWMGFYAEWKGFFSETFKGNGFLGNLGVALNDSNRDELIAFERRFESFADAMAPFGGKLPDGARTRPSTGSGDSFSKHLEGLGLPSLPTLAAVGAVIVAGVVVWKVFK
jgi:hypothetical protein